MRALISLNGARDDLLQCFEFSETVSLLLHHHDKPGRVVNAARERTSENPKLSILFHLTSFRHFGRNFEMFQKTYRLHFGLTLALIHDQVYH
jgi:hypothetical protein